MNETKCKCGCGFEIQQSFRHVLQNIENKLRAEYDPHYELNFTSVARCPRDNERVGGSRNSTHLLGLAADIIIENSRHRYFFVKILCEMNIRRFGVGKRFVHIDIAVGKLVLDEGEYSQDVVWVY
jgi:uncharacterized protein YcbK (DUF882 family)